MKIVVAPIAEGVILVNPRIFWRAPDVDVSDAEGGGVRITVTAYSPSVVADAAITGVGLPGCTSLRGKQGA